jgi:hypothetical protein
MASALRLRERVTKINATFAATIVAKANARVSPSPYPAYSAQA